MLSAIRRNVLLAFTAFSAIVLVVEGAVAGTITLQPEEQTVVLTDVDGGVQVEGRLILKNMGDDDAIAAVPAFSLGQWRWIGQARDLTPGETQTWKISKLVPRQDFTCAPSQGCLTDKLPETGVYPVLWSVLYQDRNGYQLSSSLLGRAALGVPVGQQPVFSSIQAKAVSKPLGGGKYSLVVTLSNSGSAKQPVYMRLHVPRELRALNAGEWIDVAPLEKITEKLEVENFSALPGSTYVTFVVLEWGEKGVRQTMGLPTALEVTKENSQEEWIFPVASLAVVLGSLLLIGVFFFFRQKGSGSESD